MSVHVLFITQDYVLVIYWDVENAEASGADDKAADYLSVFWQNKDAEKERKISQLTVLSATEVFLFHDNTSYYMSLTYNFYGCLYGCA